MSQGVAPESVSWKIGRYDVVGHLASGGMAEILLGRILGPSGFQRPVVIKRILPHLVREQGFVDMFLDEARIVAGIRHANVVQVHELGHELDNLFLVMEFLEGESCSGLARRLRANEEQLPAALAAYIIAEACAGLHAAHELKDQRGNLLNVVHRDVSPQNVFVTYSGHVKVLDFGIATAADRVTRTETGTFKGKFEYSSPEQCKGRKLDRRSDVWALGVLLFELSTGTRLFKRTGQLETLRAICEEPAVSPRTILPEYPAVLEKILLRALERNRDDRYPTALAMRHDLLAAIRTLTEHVAPEEELAALMHRLFAERIAEKAVLLKRVEAGSNVQTIPSVETDNSIEIPLAVETQSIPPVKGGTAPMELARLSGEQVVGGPRSFPDMEPAVPMQARPPWPLIAAGGGAVLVLLVVAVFLMSRSAPTADATTGPDPSASVSAAVTPSTAPVASSAPVATSVAAPAEVVLHLETVPSKAKIFVDGKERGISPVEIRMPRSTGTVDVEIRRDGYQTQHEKVVPDADQKLKLTLAPAFGPAPKASTPTTGPSANPYKRFD